jgi:hypothetical protein
MLAESSNAVSEQTFSSSFQRAVFLKLTKTSMKATGKKAQVSGQMSKTKPK